MNQHTAIQAKQVFRRAVRFGRNDIAGLVFMAAALGAGGAGIAAMDRWIDHRPGLAALVAPVPPLPQIPLAK